MSPHLRLLTAAVAVATSACSAADPPGAGVETLTSQDGLYQGDFYSTPDPTTVGSNELDFSLSVDGQPLEGAHVGIEVWMPVHGHQGPAPQVEDLGNGQYVAQEVVFTMPGAWELRIFVDDGDARDEFVLERQAL